METLSERNRNEINLRKKTRQPKIRTLIISFSEDKLDWIRLTHFMVFIVTDARERKLFFFSHPDLCVKIYLTSEANFKHSY